MAEEREHRGQFGFRGRLRTPEERIDDILNVQRPGVIFGLAAADMMESENYGEALRRYRKMVEDAFRLDDVIGVESMGGSEEANI